MVSHFCLLHDFQLTGNERQLKTFDFGVAIFIDNEHCLHFQTIKPGSLLTLCGV